MNDINAPIPCPTCSRPILLDELRCRSCGTRLEEYSADAEELDFSDEDWEEDLSPDRGFVVFARVTAGLALACVIGMFGVGMSRMETAWDQIALSLVALILGAMLLRPIKMLYFGA